MNTFARLAGTIALLLMALVGLLMSLCGGVFTVVTLDSREMAGIFVISIPSLLAGLAALWIACRKLRRRLVRPPAG